MFDTAYKCLAKSTTMPTNMLTDVRQYLQMFDGTYKHTDNCSAEPTNIPTIVRQSLQTCLQMFDEAYNCSTDPVQPYFLYIDLKFYYVKVRNSLLTFYEVNILLIGLQI